MKTVAPLGDRYVQQEFSPLPTHESTPNERNRGIDGGDFGKLEAALPCDEEADLFTDRGRLQYGGDVAEATGKTEGQGCR